MICHVWGFKSTLAQMCAGDACLYWAIWITHNESKVEKHHSVWHKETNLAGNNLDSRRDRTKLFSNSTQLTAWSLTPSFKVVSFWSCLNGTVLPSFSRPTMVASFLNLNKRFVIQLRQLKCCCRLWQMSLCYVAFNAELSSVVNN